MARRRFASLLLLLLIVPALADAGWAIKRDDGTYRAWFMWDQGSTLGAGESWEQRSTPPVVSGSGPNVAGFKAWLDANMSFTLRNNVRKVYPAFLDDLNGQRWADFQAGCILAKTDVPITNGQWTAFKGAVTTYKIPVTLP